MTDIAYSRNERSISSGKPDGLDVAERLLDHVVRHCRALLVRGTGGDRDAVSIATIDATRHTSRKRTSFGVLLDEPAPGGDVVAHQRGEHLVGDRRLLDGDLQQRARLATHGGLAELLPVHLGEALEAVHLDLAGRVRLFERAQRGVVLQVRALLADVGAEQRGLREVDAARVTMSPSWR